MKYFKNIIILILLIITINVFCIPNRDEDYSKGPLVGKNVYTPYMIYFNFKNLRATEGKDFEFQYSTGTYLTNDFMLDYNFFPYYYKTKSTENINDFIALDYDGLVNEISFSFYLKKNLQFGTDFRLISYYGGFMDDVVEGFHKMMGLYPNYNGGREYHVKNRVHINVFNYNNVSLQLSDPATTFGDIDTWIKYTYFQNKFVSLGMIGAFKIPTGLVSAISGSGYPDIGFQLLGDFKPVWFFSAYLQAGIVVPFDSLIPSAPSKPYPMFNGLLGLEINPFSFFSLVGQLNVKTSPIKGDFDIYNNLGQITELFSSPQTNILVGVKFKYRDLMWQFYVEENAFTLAGTDVTFNLSFSNSLRFVK